MKRLLLLLAFLFCLPASAQKLEVIELHHKSAEQVLPVLLPLVEPGGTLTGVDNRLFLRASPGNRAEIARVLAAIDTPVRRLIIRVARDRQAEAGSRGGEARGEVVLGSTHRQRADATVWDTNSARSEQGAQMVQTVDGGQAFIQVGSSQPIPLHQVVRGPGGAVVSDTVVYRDIGQGFYVMPHLNGRRVTLDISQQADSRGTHGSVNTQRLSTTVSGRLGEWIELGGSGRQASGETSGALNLSTSDARDNRSIWLKVEEVE